MRALGCHHFPQSVGRNVTEHELGSSCCLYKLNAAEMAGSISAACDVCAREGSFIKVFVNRRRLASRFLSAAAFLLSSQSSRQEESTSLLFGFVSTDKVGHLFGKNTEIAQPTEFVAAKTLYELWTFTFTCLCIVCVATSEISSAEGRSR